ncbi:MAG: hypothetical protein ACQGQO_00405 [Sphaerochaetaceae bacterium]
MNEKNVNRMHIRNFLLIGIIVTFIACLLLFIFEVRSSAFWTSFAFVLAGIVILFSIGAFCISKPRCYPFSIALVRSAFIYDIIQIAVSAVFIALGSRVQTKWLLIVQSCLLCIFLIRGISIYGGLKEIDVQDESTRDKRDFIRSLANRVSGLESPEAKKLEESIRYSDPVSDSSLADLEAQMTGLVDDLCNLEDKPEEFSKKAEELIALIKIRNDRCKLLKK